MNAAPCLLAMRPWLAEDTLFVALALFLLGLLVVFTRFRSFSSIGGLVGTLLGCLPAATITSAHANKAIWILGSCLLGFLVGGMMHLSWSHETTVSPHAGNRNGLTYWAIAFGVAGTSLGMTIGGFLVTSLMGWVGAMLMGGVVGTMIGLLCARTVSEKAGECLLVLALSAGTAAIVGWKIVWPDFVELGCRLVDEDERMQLLQTTTFVSAGVGSFLGMVIWVAVLLKKRAPSISIPTLGKPAS